MPDTSLESYIKQLRLHFRGSDRRAAHRASEQVLREMAQDPQVLISIVRKNLQSPGFLEKKRINPVLAMEIEKNADFELILHAWLPLPDRSTETSHQSIHHHGNLLLTSVSPFGPGYESILFSPDYHIDKESEEACLKPLRYYHNRLHNLEFIESQTPHIVFYPPALSITYALWSSEKPTLTGGLKGNKLVQKYKKQAKSILNTLGLAKAAGLNVVEYFDFHLQGGKVWAMKQRVTYPEGTHENFAQNLFHFLQQIDFTDYDFIEKLPQVSPAVSRWKQAFLERQPIADRFEPSHLGIAKINLSKQAMLSHFNLETTQPYA